MIKSDDTVNTDTETGVSTNPLALSVVLGISATTVFVLIKSKKGKKACIILLAGAIGLSSLGTLYAKDNLETKQFTFFSNFEINEKKYEIKTNVTYKIEKSEEATSDDYLTRGEWINQLVEAMDYEEMDFQLNEPYFIDTEDSIFEDSINYAVMYKVVELSSSHFNPQELATREFMAFTTVNALGYEKEKNLECLDSYLLKYPKEAEVAVGIGAITLENGYFKPSEFITQADANKALSVVKETRESEYIGDESKNEVVYQDNVISLSKDNVISLNDSTLILKRNNETEKIQIKDTIAIEEYGVFKIEQIQLQETTIVLGTSTPKFEETIESLETVGSGELQPSGFIPAEGVNYIFEGEETNQINPRVNLINVSGSITDAGSWNLDFKKKINDNVTLSGYLNLNLDAIKYKADIDVSFTGVDINNVYLKVQPDVDSEAKVSIKNNGDEDFNNNGYIKIGKVPVVGVPGASIFIEIGIEYRADGYARVIYTLDGQYGLQIKDNRPRIINSFSNTLSFEVNANLSFGPRLAAMVNVLNTWDLLDLDIAAGASGSGTAAFRSTGVICSDLKAHLYLRFDALKNCLVGEFLNKDYSKEIWNQSNSPIKYDGHFENFKEVDECTFEKAVLKGKVIDAETREVLNRAKIEIIDTESDERKTVYSNSNGDFSVNVAGGSTYDVITSKEGYITFKDTIDLSSHEIKQIETRLAIRGSNDSTELGKAGGSIKDAVTGETVSNVKLEVRKNWGQITGAPIKEYYTDEQGQYYIDDLTLGNYTLNMVKDGYITSYINIVVTKTGNLQQHGVIVPEEIEGENSELRVVLTWGENPTDLDSHLTGVSPLGEKYHIYFGDQSFYENENIIADLDVDDTTSYGPETLTLYQSKPGKIYHYYVHDYINQGLSDSNEMSNSGARLSIFVDGLYRETMYIPTNKAGTVWHAFDYNPDTKEIIKINQISSDESNVFSRVMIPNK